ncbi:MAG: PilZ domain-containing protein [Desulfobacteraceae bacterium]|nr:PilZ domain-containing protein [Desulfobacteraceae bacterium]
MENKGADRRRKTRVSFDTDVIIRVDGSDVSAQADSKDISINGMFVNTDADIAVDTLCDIDIILGANTEGLAIKVKGKVVRKQENGLGISFESVAMDSYIHLKNLLRFNADDPDAIESETFE